MPAASRRGFLIVYALGIALAVGSVVELLGLVFEGDLGSSGALLEELHRDPVVRAWVIIQNLIMLGVGLVFFRGARTLRTGSDSPKLRIAALVLLATALCSQVVSSFALYPRLLAEMERSREAVFWFASMVGSAVALGGFAAGLYWWLRRRARGSNRPSSDDVAPAEHVVAARPPTG